MKSLTKTFILFGICIGLLFIYAGYNKYQESKNPTIAPFDTEAFNKKADENVHKAAKVEFGKELQGLYKKKGYNIEVVVKGINNDILVLKSKQFNISWESKLQEEGEIDRWKKLGYRTVEMTDGYKYHKSWHF